MNYTYYLLDNGSGAPYEIYRSPAAEEPFHQRPVERAKKDGSWSRDEAEVRLVINLWLKGDFDPEADEICEMDARRLLEDWRNDWPGRP